MAIQDSLSLSLKKKKREGRKQNNTVCILCCLLESTPPLKMARQSSRAHSEKVSDFPGPQLLPFHSLGGLVLASCVPSSQGSEKSAFRGVWDSSKIPVSLPLALSGWWERKYLAFPSSQPPAGRAGTWAGKKGE